MKGFGKYTVAALACALFLTGQALAQEVASIPMVYGDGEQVGAVAVKYDSNMDGKSLSTSDYVVPGKTIESVYTNWTAAVPDKSVPGPYVVAKLAHENSVPFMQQRRSEQKNGQKMDNKPQGDGHQGGPANGDAPMYSDRKAPDLAAAIQQVQPVMDVNGKIYPAMAEAAASTAQAPSILDDFLTLDYTDEETGATIPYNLYLPAGYDPAEEYPMVVFIGDASANTADDTGVLYQGNGAAIWASPEEQTKHKAIVLAPQYRRDLIDQLGMMTTDKNEWTKGLTLVKNLIHHVMSRYRVDSDRVYGTGQSQGGMANIALSIDDPDLFAAQYLVACQWNVEKMGVMKDKNLWIVVCEGDGKAYPGMNAATALWESLGSKVAKSDMWDSHSDAAGFDAYVKAMEAQKAKINYAVFQGGNHMYTWSVAYNIEGIRDWLFAQKR